MKAKKDLRKPAATVHSEQDGKGKKLVPEKKVKNEKRALFEEIEEEEEIDYLSIREKDSIEDYFEDDEIEDIDDEDYEDIDEEEEE